MKAATGVLKPLTPRLKRVYVRPQWERYRGGDADEAGKEARSDDRRCGEDAW